MLDPDISARDARALLSIRADASTLTPEGLNRRRFLQLVGLGLGGGALIGNIMPGLLPGDWREAFGAPLGPTDSILVLIGLYGGNDGLNTVVPYSNPKYHDYRANIALPTNQLHVLDDSYGLHPNLNYVKSLWDQQQVAIVHGL